MSRSYHGDSLGTLQHNGREEIDWHRDSDTLLTEFLRDSSVYLRACTIWYNLEFINDCQVIVVSYLYFKM